MLKPGPAKKVTVYIGEDVHHRGEPLYMEVLNYLFQHGVAGATVTKGVAGFGSHHHIHTSRLLELTENLPVRIEFIEAPEKVEAILPKLAGIVTDGVIEMQDTTVIAASGAPSRT
jgi:PII-like signaling protein